MAVFSNNEYHELTEELTAAKARIAELEEDLAEAKEDADEWHVAAVAEGKAKLRAEADARMFTHLVVVLGKRVTQLEDDLIYRLEGLLPETDYEALGYPETRVWSLSLYDLDILVYQSATWRDLFLTLCTELPTDNE